MCNGQCPRFNENSLNMINIPLICNSSDSNVVFATTGCRATGGPPGALTPDDPQDVLSFSRTVLMAERCFRGGMGSRAKVARVVAIETPDNSASEEEEEQQEIQVRGFLIQLPS